MTNEPVTFGVCKCGGAIALFRSRRPGAAHTELAAACLNCDLVRELGYGKPDIQGAALSQAATSPVFEQLMKFYNVTSLEKLVLAQSEHVERLQKKLPPIRDERPGYVPREG